MVRRNRTSGNVQRENRDSSSSSSIETEGWFSDPVDAKGCRPGLSRTGCSSSRTVLSMRASSLRHVKRVVSELFTHRRTRTMSRQQQAILRQCQDVPSDRFQVSVIELSRHRLSDRSGKQRITHERNRTPGHLNTITNSTRRMTGGRKTLNRQLADSNRPSMHWRNKLFRRRLPMEQRQI